MEKSEFFGRAGRRNRKNFHKTKLGSQSHSLPLLFGITLIALVFGGNVAASGSDTLDELPTFEPPPPVLKAPPPPPQFLPPAPIPPPPSAPAIPGIWVELGPAPTTNGGVTIPPLKPIAGAIQTVAAHPSNADILYIGAVNGGVWRTTNATAASPNWTPLTDKLLSLSIGSLEFDPTDGSRQTLVAGSARTSSFAARGGLLIGMMRTTDGGNNWAVLGGTLFANENLTSVAARGNILMAASDNANAGAGTGLFRSTNTGASFQLVSGAFGTGLPSGPVSDLVGDPGNPNRFYAAVRTTGVFRSDDGGATWTNVTTGIPGVGGNTSKIEMAIHNSGAGNVIYVGTITNGRLAGVFRSANQGGAWTAMDVPAAHPNANPQGATHFGIAADSASTTIVYLGGDGGTHLFRGDSTLAAGSQFTAIQGANTGNTTPHADTREMVFDANGNLVETDDGGIYRLVSPSSNAATWNSPIGNLAVMEAHDIGWDGNANIAMIGAQDNGTQIQTVTGSKTWVMIVGADGGDVAIDDRSSTSQSIRYGSTQNAGSFFRRTYDTANNLTLAESPPLTVLAGGPAITWQFVTPIELNKVDPTRLIIGGGNSPYESFDRGDTVTALSVGNGVNRMAVAYGGWLFGVPNADVLYYGSGATVQLRTTPGGTVAATATPFPGSTVVDLIMAGSDWRRLWAIDSSRIYYTPDAGATWDDVTGDLTGVGNLRSVEFFRFGRDCVAVGTDTGVYCSFNNSETWAKLGSGLPSVTSFDLVFHPADRLLLVGTLSRGAWSIQIPEDVPVITIPDDVFFTDTCVGTTNFATLYVCNTGTADLHVGPITSNNPRFSVLPPSSGYPVTISPDFCFPFRVRFTPTTTGDQQATFTVPSDDPVNPTNFVQAFGTGIGPTIATFMPNAGNFGDVCLGNFRDLTLTINNAGGCTLLVTNITSTLPNQFIVPVVVNFPLVIHPGDSVAVPIRFQPSGAFGPRSGTIVVGSTDPVSPNRMISVSGNVPSGDVRVTGSTDFGEVCAGSINEKTISICNVGLCNLLVSNVSFVMPCPDFILVNNPFPAIVSHDFCVDVVIRFTPTSCGTKTCTLRIVTDDPDTPIITLTVTASSPCGSIDVPPDLAFEPEVIQTVGSCKSELPFPISNTGFCPLVITAITIGGVDAGDFSFSGLPSFPIILEPGHIVGQGDLAVVFAPTVVDRDRLATITVTYVTDPISGATANIVRRVGGEGVRTGARVLVTHAGIPVANVERIHLQRINANRNRNRLDTQDNVNDLPLVTVIPAAPVEPFQYHREYGTVSNPIQLLPGSYQVTATAIINGKRRTLVVGFDVQTCDFNPTVVVDF